MSAPRSAVSLACWLVGAVLAAACSSDVTPSNSAGFAAEACPGRIACGEACVDSENDNAHCGACETVCAGAQVCSASRCRADCEGGRTKCDGACVDIASDKAHCGACSKVCSARRRGEPSPTETPATPRPGSESAHLDASTRRAQTARDGATPVSARAARRPHARCLPTEIA